MNKSSIYKNAKTYKAFFTEDDYIRYMQLLKLLYRLEIIDDDCVIDSATEFHLFFV